MLLGSLLCNFRFYISQLMYGSLSYSLVESPPDSVDLKIAIMGYLQFSWNCQAFSSFLPLLRCFTLLLSFSGVACHSCIIAVNMLFPFTPQAIAVSLYSSLLSRSHFLELSYTPLSVANERLCMVILGGSWPSKYDCIHYFALGLISRSVNLSRWTLWSSVGALSAVCNLGDHYFDSLLF